MNKPKKRISTAGKAKYELTEPERAALTKHIARLDAEPSAPSVKVLDSGGSKSIVPDHPDAFIARGLLMEAVGTGSAEFFDALISQLGNASAIDGQVNSTDLNFMLSVIKGIGSNDQLLTMLAAQMTLVHLATMRHAQQLANAETISHQDSAERTFNKLARTFVSQLEAIKSYRTGGEQKVTVTHVSVNEGGQAIVGNVTQDARESASQKSAAKPLALTDSRQQPMPILEERKRMHDPVPVRRKQKNDGQSSS
jgi:hypothetical protein